MSPGRGGEAVEWRAEARGETSREVREEGEEGLEDRKDEAEGLGRGLREVPKARERVKSLIRRFERGGGMAISWGDVGGRGGRGDENVDEEVGRRDVGGDVVEVRILSLIGFLFESGVSFRFGCGGVLYCRQQQTRVAQACVQIYARVRRTRLWGRPATVGGGGGVRVSVSGVNCGRWRVCSGAAADVKINGDFPKQLREVCGGRGVVVAGPNLVLRRRVEYLWVELQQAASDLAPLGVCLKLRSRGGRGGRRSKTRAGEWASGGRSSKDLSTHLSNQRAGDQR